MLKSRNVIEVTLSYISFAVIGMPGALRGIIWPTMREQFGLPLDGLAALIVAGTISYAVSSFFSGRVISVLGMRWALALGAIVSAIGIFGYAMAPSWLFVLGSSLVSGIGGGVIDSGLNLHFARVYSARLMNWLHAAFGLGAAVGPLFLTWFLASGQSWQVAYFIIGLAQVAVGIAFAVILRNEPATEVMQTEGSVAKRATVSIQETLRQPLVWLSIVMFLLYAGVEITPSDWTPSLLTTARNFDEPTAGTWVGLYWLSFTLGRIIFGFIANRVPVNAGIRGCLIGMIVGVALMWWNPSSSVSLIGLLILGFGLGPIFPLLITATPERLGDAHATNAVGFQVAAASAGIGLLPSIAGALGARYGLEIILPFMLIISIVLYGLFQIMSLKRFTLVLEPQRS